MLVRTIPDKNVHKFYNKTLNNFTSYSLRFSLVANVLTALDKNSTIST